MKQRFYFLKSLRWRIYALHKNDAVLAVNIQNICMRLTWANTTVYFKE